LFNVQINNKDVLSKIIAREATNIDILEKDISGLKKTREQLQTIPENNKFFAQAQKSIIKYQKEIEEIDQKIPHEKLAQT